MRNRLGKPGTAPLDYAAIRRTNGAFLLGLLRENGPVSRAELSRLSGLTKPTVSSQITSLLERGIVIEDGVVVPDARGGKPSTLVRFNPDLGHLAAVEIGASEVRVRLTDLDGKGIDAEVAPIHADRSADHVLEKVVLAVERVRMRERGRREKLMVAAIAAPGRIHPEEGKVVEAGNVFHWSNVAVREPLERAFGVPVVVENDVNFAALGEMHCGLGRGIQNFLLIRHSTGIAAGLVFGGRLYRGTHGTAGEIGHMVFDRETAAGAIDPRGFLESAIGLDRIRERLQAAAPPADAGNAPAANGRFDLLEAIQARNPAAAAIADDLESKLTLAVANVAAVADPELIILTGDLMGLVAGQIQSAVKAVVPWPIRIEISALGDEAILLGAIGAAQEVAHDLLCGKQSRMASG